MVDQEKTDPEERKVAQGHVENKVNKENEVWLVHQEYQGFLAPVDHRVTQVKMDSTGKMEQWDQMDQLESQEQQEIPEVMAQMEYPEEMATQEIQALGAIEATKDPVETLDQ